MDCGRDESGRRGRARSSSDVRILVVDDDDQIRDIAARQLASLGYEVVKTSSGADALAMLERDAGIELLFVDLNMPDMCGATVAAEASRLRPDLKILFASGVGGPPDGGGAPFLMKPYRKKQLAEKIVEVLGRH